MRSVLTRTRTRTGEHDAPRRWLLPAGLGLFAVALGLYVIYTVIHPQSFTMDPVDLAVYRSGGLIVRHVRPLYDPRLAAPLYDWIGYGKLHLPFTYTPFAAIAFALISFVPWWLSQQLSAGSATGKTRRGWPLPCSARPPSSGPNPSCAPCTWARSTWS